MKKSSIIIRSAGRTLKGRAHEQNSDYFCCFEYPLSEAIRGVYGVADGGRSPKEGARASEMAVEILKDKIKKARENAEEPFAETLVERTFKDIHRELRSQRTAENEPATIASLTCGCLVRDTFYFGHAGTCAAYLIEGGAVHRLTEDLKPADGDMPEEQRRRLIGLEENLQADYFTHRVTRNATLIFCSNGLPARVENIAIQESVVKADSPDQVAEMLVNLAVSRGETDDITVVVVSLTVKDVETPEYVPGIRYPVGMLATKYVSVALLLCVLSLMYHYRGIYLNIYAEGQRPSQTQVAVNTSGPAPAMPVMPVVPHSKLTLESNPSGALVYVDGMEQGKGTPIELELPDGKSYTIRLQREGYQPYEGEVRLENGVDEYRKISLKKASESAQPSVLAIRCEQTCEDVYLDGRKIGNASVRELMLQDVPAGVHTITAVREGTTKTEKVRLVSGGSRIVAFTFPVREATPVEEIVRATGRTDSGNTPPAPVMRRAEPVIAVHRPTVGTAPEGRAYMVVKSNVSAGSVMVFDGTRLVFAGFTGDRVDLAPGKYKVQVSKDGYTPVVRDVTVDQGLQVVQVDLR